MLFWNKREQITLSVLGLSALVALTLIALQKRRLPILLNRYEAASSYQVFDLQLKKTKQININSATREELERLPGVGPSLAEGIIKHREKNGRFRKASDLEKIHGIGPKTIKDVGEYIVFE